MGLLTTLFGIVPYEQPPQLQSIYPLAAVQRVQMGKLPTIQADRIILASGEVCHYVEVGAAVTQKMRRHTSHTGGSYRIAKGITSHIGQSQSVPVSEPHFTKGIFYITNRRVIFVARENAFERQIRKLTAVTPYSDAITLQFGSKAFSIMLPDGSLAAQVINLIV